MEVGMTIPQLKLTIGKDRLGTRVWWTAGLTIIKLRLELTMDRRIGNSSDSLGTKTWQ